MCDNNTIDTLILSLLFSIIKYNIRIVYLVMLSLLTGTCKCSIRRNKGALQGAVGVKSLAASSGKGEMGESGLFCR